MLVSLFLCSLHIFLIVQLISYEKWQIVHLVDKSMTLSTVLRSVHTVYMSPFCFV